MKPSVLPSTLRLCHMKIICLSQLCFPTKIIIKVPSSILGNSLHILSIWMASLIAQKHILPSYNLFFWRRALLGQCSNESHSQSHLEIHQWQFSGWRRRLCRPLTRSAEPDKGGQWVRHREESEAAYHHPGTVGQS